jgi:hypothetical protein
MATTVDAVTAATATPDDLSRGVRQLEVLGAKLVGGTPPTYTDPPSPLLLIVLTGLLIGILAVFMAFAEYNEIRSNWSEYQCSPSVMPFAKFYGHDLNATINFCMQQAVKEHAPGVVEPIYKAIGAVATTVDGVFTKAEAVEGGVASLLAGFETFVTNFVNSLRLVGTRIRMSVVRMKEIFGRIHGIFIAFAYAGISALTFGENLACNPLVTFMGTITGVDVCCFAPNTQVRTASGRNVRIDQIRIGDCLWGDSRVTSVYRFDGTSTRMVQIDNIVVSAGHYVEGGTGPGLIPAEDHPLAAEVPPISLLICLATDNHRIPVVRRDDSILVCADYEESSDPAVCAAAQSAAETFLNGVTGVEEPLPDYSLGLGPAVSVQIAGGFWIPVNTVSIGTRLANGGTVAGVIQEECELVTEIEPGVHVAAAQLLLNQETVRWRRAGRIWPAATQEGLRTLHHLLVAGGDNSFLIRTPGGQHFLARDYSEVDDPSVQEPYDRAVTGGSS